MATRSVARPVGLAATVTALVVAAGLLLSLVQPKPVGAASGLEDLVGPIEPAVAAQLPADPRLWGSYSLRPTPDVCPRGELRCVDAVIADMTRRFNRLAPRCDHDAVFSLLYLRVTEYYRQVVVQPGYFLQPRRVNREDVIFAQLYVGAYDDWHANRPTRVPPSWRLAFAAADARQVSGSGDALLGMNAHILRDLPFTLWRISLVDHRDHLKVNQMLSEVYDSVIKEVSDRFDPTIGLASTVPGTKTPVMEAVVQWREKAWRDAVALVQAPDRASWTKVAERIEREAWANALSIYLASRYPAQQATAVRDSYRAANWNS